MSERIEFVGDPLPTGLPGFGGGTVSVLILPGFNTVVAVQQFGPVIEVVAGPGVTPPNPQPPAGSNPENPTNEVVPPGTAPAGSGASNNFCERCVPPTVLDEGQPIYYAKTEQSGCTDCQGFRPGQVATPKTASSNGGDDGIHFANPSTLRGDGDGFYWQLSKTGMLMGEDGGKQVSIGITGDPFLSLMEQDGDFTKFDVGPKITGDDGKVYQPQDLEVCNGTTTETWKVLAYKPD